MNQFLVQADRTFQTAHSRFTITHQIHNNTLSKSSSHSFNSNITLRTE